MYDTKERKKKNVRKLKKGSQKVRKREMTKPLIRKIKLETDQ